MARDDARGAPALYDAGSLAPASEVMVTNQGAP
jgi:hypothetical protein